METAAIETQKTDEKDCNPKECMSALLPVRDALEVLSGRWKLPI
ncbi:hypothetical protein [Flavobacterium sp. Root901]|nr:hypothetical protein [Flavobacterium sp. Root901]